MKNILYISLIFLLAIAGCTEDTALTPETDLIVIRGYLYANEPVYDIQVWQSTSSTHREFPARRARPLHR